MRCLPILFLAIPLLTGCGSNEPKEEEPEPYHMEPEFGEDTARADLRYPEEKHLKNVRQLTFGGNNAEAYFSFDDKSIIFQSDYAAWGNQCDQIYLHELANGPMNDRPQLISTGDGRTTCAFFLPGDSEVIYASTHLADTACPPPPGRIKGKYLWPIYDSYDLFAADRQGKLKRQLTKEKGYDAEATVSPKGDKVVFTSTRSGDLELWLMNTDGSGLKQLTNQLGYDGGAFFSPDGKKLVFRSSRPKTDEEVKEYKELLAKGLVAPTNMEIYTINIDGTGLRQITQLGHANWAPYFHPSGNKIIFSSNHKQGGFSFNLYMTDLEGKNIEQITHDPTFDAFPMFSYDGKKLIFSSNRNNGGSHDTNLFLADWVE